MYHYDQAIALSKQLDSTFQNVDLSNVPANFLFTNYVDGFIKLKYDYSVDPVYISISVLKQEYYLSIKTISDIISSKPSGYFKDIGPSCFNSVVKYAKYGDAIMSGYTVKFINRNITLSKSNVTSDYFLSNTLVTINGYIHDCYKTSDTEISIKNGVLSANKTKKGNVGILTFADIGTITKYKLSNSNIKKDISTDMMSNTFIQINVTDDSTSTYYMSLGGYLLPLTNTGALRYLGGGLFSLSLSMFGYMNKFLESNEYTYLDVLEGGDVNGVINTSFLSDEVSIIRYLTLDNTFIFSVPKKNIVNNKTLLVKQPLYNSFTTPTLPNNPLFTSTGRMVDYYYVEQDYDYLVTATNIEVNNFNAYELSTQSSPTMTAQRDPNAPLKNNLVFKQIGFY